MSQARSFCGCTTLNKRLIVFGGDLNENENTDSVEIYDIESDVWSSGPTLTLPLVTFGYASTN